jgi:hypothetical protein
MSKEHFLEKRGLYKGKFGVLPFDILVKCDRKNLLSCPKIVKVSEKPGTREHTRLTSLF